MILLFLKPMKMWFFIVYTFTGITDALDGWVARKTNTISSFGSKLDSIADLMLYSIMLIKVFPVMWVVLPVAIWYVVAVVLILRVSAYIIAAVKYRRFASEHTFLNKLTSASVFTVPYILLSSWAVPICWTICILGGIASAEEVIIHIFGKKNDAKSPSSIAGNPSSHTV